MIHIRLQKDTCHVTDHLFVLCMMAGPKPHFIKNSPSSPRKKKNYLEHLVIIICFANEKISKKLIKCITSAFVQKPSVGSVKPQSICVTYLHHFSHRELPCLKIKLVSPLCLVPPIAYTLLTSLQVQLALANNTYWLSKWHLAFFARKRLPKSEVWGHSGKEEWARITHSPVRPYLVKSWKRQYFCCIWDTSSFTQWIEVARLPLFQQSGRIFACMCMYMHMYIHVCISVHVYTHIYTYFQALRRIFLLEF